jgi:poly-gamma-glutamate capsule biosynthesis protein CapA/YwtB (metallophosphatase superfamily)
MLALGSFAPVPQYAWAAGSSEMTSSATQAPGNGDAQSSADASSEADTPPSAETPPDPDVPLSTETTPSDDTSPSIDPTPTPTAEASMTLLAVGDLMCHATQLRAARSGGRYDFTPAFAPVARTVSSADIALGNLETTLSNLPPWMGYPKFRSPPSYASALKRTGFDVLSTANNHTLDGGAKGVRNTSKVLDQLKIAHVGSDNHTIAIVSRRGIKIAFLSYTFGTNGIGSPFKGAVNRLNLGQMRRDIKSAHKHSDFVVVVVHWGKEYSRTPEHATRKLGRALIDSGADLILGSHPHVVRPIERYHGHYIVYSMGNFISGQSKSKTDLGIMVQAKIVKRASGTVVAKLKVLPVYRDRTSGAGRRSYRTVLIDRALSGRESMISGSDKRTMRSYRAYCRKMFKGYY